MAKKLSWSLALIAPAVILASPIFAETRAGDALPAAALPLASALAQEAGSVPEVRNSCLEYDGQATYYEADAAGNWILDAAGNMISCDPSAGLPPEGSGAGGGAGGGFNAGLGLASAGFLGFVATQLGDSDSPG